MFACETTPIRRFAAAGWARTSIPATNARPPVGTTVVVEHPDRRRLAGAVRAEQPEELAGLDLEVDPVDGRHRAGVARKDLAEPLRPDRRLTPRRRRLESRRDRHRQRLPAIAAAGARPRLAANAPPRCIPTRLRDGPPPGGQRACGARADPAGRRRASGSPRLRAVRLLGIDVGGGEEVEIDFTGTAPSIRATSTVRSR